MLKCKACARKAVERGFCIMHSKAYENILEKYEMWGKALKISWKEYLSEIEQHPFTGEWAKEVANYLVNNEGTRSVEEN